MSFLYIFGAKTPIIFQFNSIPLKNNNQANEGKGIFEKIRSKNQNVT